MMSVIFVSALLSFNITHAQRLYINAAGGMMNYAGDLQSKHFTFQQAHLALGFGLSYKLTGHIYVSTNYMFGKVNADDKYSTDFKKRNLNFSSNIQEGNLVIEGDIFDITKNIPATLYIFGGAGAYHFNPYTFDTARNKVFLQPLGTEGQDLPQYPERKKYSLTQFNLVYGPGIKYAITPQFIFAFEIGFRTLFTDYLDDVSTTYPDQAVLLNARGPLAAKLSFRGDELNPPTTIRSDRQRGNTGRNDTYYFCIFKLSYGLHFEGGSGRHFSSKIRRQSECPKKVL